MSEMQLRVYAETIAYNKAHVPCKLHELIEKYEKLVEHITHLDRKIISSCRACF